MDYITKIILQYILKLFSHVKSIARKFILQKRVVIPSSIVIVLLLLAIPTVYLFDIINGSKDYASVLAAQDVINRPLKNATESGQGNSAGPAAGLSQPTSEGNGKKNDVAQIKTSNSSVINILLLGIDRTEERDVSIGVSRSDSIAVASINLDTKKVNVLSIPRDTYTYVPVESKEDKINHAYAFGSVKGDAVKGSVDAVERFIKYARIDYYFTVDMQPVPEIVDKLGGVELDVNFEIKDELQKGRQLLDGDKPLKYISYRGTANGDIDRIIHQQKFARAMLDKLKDSGKLTDALDIVLNYSKFVKTNMNLKQMAALARLCNDIPAGNSSYFIVPGEDRMLDGTWYYMPDAAKTEAMLKEIFQ